jgi:hypothetical protein
MFDEHTVLETVIMGNVYIHQKRNGWTLFRYKNADI